MSEKESDFIKLLKYIVGSLILTIIGGSFVFYSTTIEERASQEEKHKAIEIRMNAQETKSETMRIEWRQDQEKINTNMDKIATRLNEQAGYILRQK